MATTAVKSKGVALKKKGKSEVEREVLEARLEDLERKLDRLRGLYESFFMGIERAPPNVPRRELNRLVIETQQIMITNASLRFRFQSILQRWVLFTTYWNRTLREMEAGTYRRDVARAQRHMADKVGTITEEDALRLGIPASRVKAFIERQNRLAAVRGAGAGGGVVKRPGAPAGPGQPVGDIPGISDDIQGVYQRYLDTHRRVGDPRPALTLDKITERLRAQVPKILAEKNCRKVKLDIAVEDGKVRLKAWPVGD